MAYNLVKGNHFNSGTTTRAAVAPAEAAAAAAAPPPPPLAGRQRYQQQKWQQQQHRYHNEHKERSLRMAKGALGVVPPLVCPISLPCSALPPPLLRSCLPPTSFTHSLPHPLSAPLSLPTPLLPALPPLLTSLHLSSSLPPLTCSVTASNIISGSGPRHWSFLHIRLGLSTLVCMWEL